MESMGIADSIEGFGGGLHKIVAIAAVDVHVDASWSDVASLNIDYMCTWSGCAVGTD